MAFNPITVNKGPSAEPHIYAEDDASIFQCMFGEDGILDIGSKLELSIQSNNLVRMSDGVLCIGGHIGRVKYADYADLTIDNGETGYNRNDLIIGSFSNTGEHTIDTFEPQVIKGTPATGDAVDPTLTEGSLYEGDHLRQKAIARVKLEGLNIVGIDMLLPVIPSIPSLKALLDELNGKISGAAGQIVWCGTMNLLYNSASDMQGVVNNPPSDIFDNPSNYTVLVTMRNISGTAYGQVSRLTYDIRTSQWVLVIDGYGAGFVSGHVVSVSVLIVKKL